MDSISFTLNGDEEDLRQRLSAPALDASQDLYVSDALKTGRVMVKDEDVCLHCGLWAERCPTGAWDMQKFLFASTYAGPGCRNAGSPPPLPEPAGTPSPEKRPRARQKPAPAPDQQTALGTKMCIRDSRRPGRTR